MYIKRLNKHSAMPLNMQGKYRQLHTVDIGG